jgi:trans-aconitate 2-methyltransferase
LHLKGSEKVLDIGCRDGKLGAEIARKLPEGFILGVDLSKAMITFARDHYSPENFPNFAFVQMDATNLSFNSEFDVVFSNATLHWIKDHKLILEGIWKSLKPGGTLLVQLGGKGKAAEIFKIIDSMLENKKWSPYFRNFVFPFGYYEPGEYGEWLKNAGFLVKRLELNPKNVVLEGKKEFWNGWVLWSCILIHSEFFKVWKRTL